MRMTKLALVQFESVLMDIDANVYKAERFIAQAAGQGADLVVFPELFLTGYDLLAIGETYGSLAQSIDGESVGAIREAAKRYGTNVVAPMALRSGSGNIVNGAIIIDRQGQLVGSYGKVHLWEDEHQYFTPGDAYTVVELDFGTIGLLICYDAGFPEAARTLALRGAELIVIPAAFEIADKHRYDIYFQARALENTCFVAAVNGVGGGGGTKLFGNNRVAGPGGDLLLSARLDHEEMQILEIDLEDNTTYAKRIPYLRDMRLETYGYLV